jgi:phosphatidylglycerol:prolipoprotein diacylglycerol transferase
MRLPLFALPFPAIDPVLIEIGPFAIRWYALAYITGIFFGWWYARRLVANPALWGPGGAPMTASDLDDFVVWAAIGIVGGGRLGYVLFYDLPHYLAEPADILAVWHGGMSFHGGFLGTVIAMILFARRRAIPVWSLIDVVAPSVTVGLLLGRLANFINGELFGRVTDVPWAIVFPNGGDQPRHPSQLYEAALEGLALFIFLRILTHRYHRLATPGFVSGGFAAGYGLARTFVEFFREPDIQIGYLAGGLTMGMLLSVPMIVAGIAVMVWSARRGAAVAGSA